jgi:drug/metabolite transporter (DMT)-like permease
MMLVGVYVGLSKPLTAALPVFILASLRFFIAAVIMIPWLEPGAGRLDRSTWQTLFIQSLFGNFLFSICMLYGVALSSATTAGLVMSCLPAVVALFSWLLLREPINARTGLAIALSVVAIALLQWAQPGSHLDSLPLIEGPHKEQGSAAAKQGDDFFKGSTALGTGLLLVAVACEALYVVLGKRLSKTLSAKRNAALLNLFGLVLMLPLGIGQVIWLAKSGTPFSWSTLHWNIWALLVFYAFAASVGSTWLWFTGLRQVPASRAGVFAIGLPIAAVLVGVLVLNEPFTALHGFCLALCIAAIALVTLQRLPANK